MRRRKEEVVRAQAMDVDVVVRKDTGDIDVMMTFTPLKGEPYRVLITTDMFLRMGEGMGDLVSYIREHAA